MALQVSRTIVELVPEFLLHLAQVSPFACKVCCGVAQNLESLSLFLLSSFCVTFVVYIEVLGVFY